MAENQFEGIKSKLRKLQALAEKGYHGEADNARRAIERICAQYGISMEDVLDFGAKKKYTFEIGRSKDMMNLFVRCLDAVCDTTGMRYSKPTRSSIKIELTAIQYADVLSLFNWHKANFEREFAEFKRTFLSAYVSKHDLYYDKERNGGSDRELTPEDIARILRAMKMREAMDDNYYHKMISE